jgi:gamma-carbonic anhydrase
MNEMAELSNGGTIIPFGSKRPVIDPKAWIARGSVIIGDVEIAAGASIWFNSVVRADVQVIRIGEGTNIQDGSVIHVTRKTHGTFIGSDVMVGHKALIHGCTLQDACFVGMNATVMDGAVVETGAMVAAGALVTPRKVVKAGELWSGSPARLMRKLDDSEIAYITESAQHYAKLAEMFRTGEVPE